VHTYHYIPDVAAGLAVLGSGPTNDSDLGHAWMLPCQPADTLRALVDRLSQVLGRTIRIAQVPRWVIKFSGIFVPLFREVDEMLYQWEEPFIVDDRRFRERFGARPAELMVAASATVEWAKHHYTQTS
jgi:hypothetical protein